MLAQSSCDEKSTDLTRIQKLHVIPCRIIINITIRKIVSIFVILKKFGMILVIRRLVLSIN